jgi:uncharacterized membrane protein
MHAHFVKAWETIRASYWFVPSVMAVLAMALSFATIAVDEAVGADWIDQVGLLYANKPDGARALLSTIAGSMIGVAGVTFSITIAAVSYATGQFGPRLLTNFMRDRGNQFTLGTFIATFLYCLLVLRTIRSPDEPPPGGFSDGNSAAAAELAGAFVPHVAILVGMAFAIASVGVLIFFVHHIPESIHASNVTAGIGRELNVMIEDLFPEKLGYGVPEERDPEADVPEDFLEQAAPVRADGTGYVQYVDEQRLLGAATEHDLLLCVEYRPGDFISSGQSLLYVWPAGRLTDEIAAGLRTAFIWGRQRTQRQDAPFLARELVEIAARALSPGTNDPFTAMTCMDWLESALTNMVRRDMPDAHRYDADGTLRILAEPVDFEDFCETIFPQLRPYACDDRNAALHLMQVIAEVGRAAESEETRALLRRHAKELRTGARDGLPHPEDREELERRYRATAEVLSDGDSSRRMADEHHWFGGSG